MDLLAMEMAKNRRELKMTVLHRPGGVWHDSEVDKFTDGLMTEVSGHPQHPESIIILGHYTKEETLDEIGGGMAYTGTQVIGLQDERLPFRPGFI